MMMMMMMLSGKLNAIVCVLSDISSAVTLSFERYLGDGAADRLVSLLDCKAASFPLLVAISLGIAKCVVKKGFGWSIFGLSGTHFCHLTANISKTVSRSVTCQLELNIRSTRAF